MTVLEPGSGPRLAWRVRRRAAARAAGAAGGRRGRAAGRWRADGAHVLVTRGRNARADRLRALRRQPLLGADGVRAGRGGPAARRQGHGRRGQRVDPRAPGIEYVDVGTAAELADACAERFDACDVLMMAAAVADYRPPEAHDGKIKKDRTGGELNLSLVRTTDVLSSLADRRRPGQLIVGFAAEHGDGALAYGREKFERRNSMRSSLMTSAGPGSASSPPTTRSGSSRPTMSGTCRRRPRADRGGDPRRSLEPPFIKRHKGSTLNGTLGGGRPGAARTGRDRHCRFGRPARH